MLCAKNARRGGTHERVLPLCVVLTALAMTTLAAAQPAVADGIRPPTDHVWLAPDGEPLPFQAIEDIRLALREGRVLSREKIGRGIAGAERLELEYQGTLFRAAFRSTDITRIAPSAGSINKPSEYRDSSIFELAAFELSLMLGLQRVPPVVKREIDGVDGTLQLWLEESTPEDILIQQGKLRPPNVARWNQQKQVMYVFDNLIGNSDRNQGNLLIDGAWNIWFIDHTRAFRRTSELLSGDGMVACDRQLWQRLQEIDPKEMRRRLDPYLETKELAKLLTRHQKILRLLGKSIKAKGEDAVLFDLQPPSSPGTPHESR
jgi:hypothetical protein